MPKAIKLFFLLLLFAPFCHSQTEPCSLKAPKGLLSLSAPVSWILYELDLLEDPRLEGVSTFHFTGDKHVKKIAGGPLLVREIYGQRQGRNLL